MLMAPLNKIVISLCSNNNFNLSGNCQNDEDEEYLNVPWLNVWFGTTSIISLKFQSIMIIGVYDIFDVLI